MIIIMPDGSHSHHPDEVRTHQMISAAKYAAIIGILAFISSVKCAIIYLTTKIHKE